MKMIQQTKSPSGDVNKFNILTSADDEEEHDEFAGSTGMEQSIDDEAESECNESKEKKHHSLNIFLIERI